MALVFSNGECLDFKTLPSIVSIHFMEEYLIESGHLHAEAVLSVI